MTLAKAKAKTNETFIVQASLTIISYDRKNMLIVQATDIRLYILVSNTPAYFARDKERHIWAQEVVRLEVFVNVEAKNEVCFERNCSFRNSCLHFNLLHLGSSWSPHLLNLFYINYYLFSISYCKSKNSKMFLSVTYL